MLLTEEKKTDAYPAASMETAQAATEETLYANLPETRTAKPAGILQTIIRIQIIMLPG